MRKEDWNAGCERAIRELVQTWLAASQKRDLQTVLGLMADDVIFMLPGQNPFGKEAFAASFKGLKGVRFEMSSNIKVLADWAYLSAADVMKVLRRR